MLMTSWLRLFCVSLAHVPSNHCWYHCNLILTRLDLLLTILLIVVRARTQKKNKMEYIVAILLFLVEGKFRAIALAYAANSQLDEVRNMLTALLFWLVHRSATCVWLETKLLFLIGQLIVSVAQPGQLPHTSPENVASLLGEDVTLTCHATDLVWKDAAGRNIAPPQEPRGRYSLSGPNLTIHGVVHQDAGAYGCSNRETNAVLYTAQVIVLGKHDVVVFVKW